MSDFPALQTGAVLQYPASKETRFSTNVTMFLDGSEQRYRQFPAPLVSWIIRLEKLSEAEVQTLRDFFEAQGGRFGHFSFTDPWDGTVYPDCSLANDEFIGSYQDFERGSTQLIVRRNKT